MEVVKRRAEYYETIGDKDAELAQLVRVARMWEERLDSPESATEILETILERDPRNVAALTGLARLHERSQDWERCREVLSQAAALNPSGSDAAELYFRMGRVEDQLDNPTGALEHYAKALEWDPSHPEAISALEAAAREREDYQEVARLLQLKTAGTRDPAERLALLCELGTVHSEKLGDPDGGLPFLVQALELAPEDPDVLKPLADLYFAAGDLDKAEPLYAGLIEAATKARKRSKELAPYHYKLGAIAEQRGDAERAAAEYDKAYRIDTTYSPVVVAIGRLAMSQEDWEKARRVYRAMLLQNRDEKETGISKADVYFALGQIHERLDETKKAINMYERGKEIQDDHPGILEALARLRS